MPEAFDPVVAGASLVMALQTIVSRNVAAKDSAVVSVGAFLVVMLATSFRTVTLRRHPHQQAGNASAGVGQDQVHHRGTGRGLRVRDQIREVCRVPCWSMIPR